MHSYPIDRACTSRSLALLLLFCSLCVGLRAQPLLELNVGVEPGWWVYHKGLDDRSLSLGYDKTHLALSLSLDAGILFPMGESLRLGVHGSYRPFFSKFMRASDHQYLAPNRYQITDEQGVAHIWQAYLSLNYSIIQRAHFRIGPHIQIGSFHLDSRHPTRDNFGFRFLWSLGIDTEFRMGKRWLLMTRPQYRELNLFPRTVEAPKERHQLYSLGWIVGLRYQLSAKL